MKKENFRDIAKSYSRPWKLFSLRVGLGYLFFGA
jgi:hypothetical protein